MPPVQGRWDGIEVNPFAWLVTGLQGCAAVTFVVLGRPFDAMYWAACAVANIAVLTKP
jgi:hypothetical protein